MFEGEVPALVKQATGAGGKMDDKVQGIAPVIFWLFLVCYKGTLSLLFCHLFSILFSDDL